MKIIWSSPNLFSRHPHIRNHCFNFPPLRHHGDIFQEKQYAPKPSSLPGRARMCSLEHGACVGLRSLGAQRAAAGWTARRGWAEGPLPNTVPLIHLNADLEKLPFMGCDEVWIQSPSSLGACHFLRCDCQLSQTTSAGLAEGRGNWQGPLGKADIQRPTPQTHFIHAPLSCHYDFFFFSHTRLVPIQRHHWHGWIIYTLFDRQAKGGALLRAGLGRFSVHSLSSLNSPAPDPNQLTPYLFWTFQKGERGERAFCNFSCVQRIKCSQFNFIKSLTTDADTEDGKYAKPENSQNPTVSISIKARCSMGFSNLIKPTDDKGFSLDRLVPGPIHQYVGHEAPHQDSR